MSDQYCILLPADSPLFWHVRHGISRYLPAALRPSITVEVFNDDGGEAPNDKRLAERIQDGARFNKKQVLGGVCDPYAAEPHGLQVYAAVIKRLAFHFVWPKGLTKGCAPTQLRKIYAHGGGVAASAELFTATSSAQALARAVAFHFAGRQRIRIEPCGYEYFPDPDTTDWLLITANLFAAYTYRDQHPMLIQLADAPSLFPEWSRIMLSALVARRNRPEDSDALQNVIEAIHMACQELRFAPDDPRLGHLLFEYYPSVQELGSAGVLSGALREGRVVPSDLEPSRFGAMLSTKLWDADALSRYVLISADQRLLNHKLGEVGGIRIPDLDLNQAYRVRHASMRHSLNIDTWLRTSVFGANYSNALILVPTATECDIVLAYFEDVKVISTSPAQYVAFLRQGPEKYSVLIACCGEMGRVSTALTATAVLRRWHPDVCILVGVAGSLNEVALPKGSAMTCRKVVDYELQKVEWRDAVGSGRPRRSRNGPAAGALQKKIDWKDYHFDADLTFVVAAHIRAKHWLRHLLPEAVRPDTLPHSQEFEFDLARHVILSGDKVVATAHALSEGKAAYTHSVAVEMESAGLLAALDADGVWPCKAATIRGISDFAGADKGDSLTPEEKSIKEAWRRYACHVAGAVTKEVLLGLASVGHQNS